MQRRRPVLFPLLAVLVCLTALAVARPATAAIGDRQALVAGENDFAFAMYRGLRTANPGVNIVFAPYSLAVAIETLALGAKGDTRAQLVRAIGADGLPATRLLAASRALRDELREAEQFEFRVANILVADRSVPVSAAYRQSLSADYEQQVLPADLAASPERARVQANSWMAGATSLAFPEMFKAGSFTRNTRLVLANSLFFRGEWLRRLAVLPIGLFTRPDGSRVEARRVGTGPAGGFFPTARRANFRAIVLPYRGTRLAVALVLPDAGRFSQVEAAFTPAVLTDVLLGARKRLVAFEGPSFFLAQRIEDVRSSLAGLGVANVFDRARADLSAMAGSTRVSLDAAIHEVRFGFDALGTEEGSGVLAARGGGVNVEETFIVDRPFLFAVVDRPTGAVLYMGRVVDPTSP